MQDFLELELPRPSRITSGNRLAEGDGLIFVVMRRAEEYGVGIAVNHRQPFAFQLGDYVTHCFASVGGNRGSNIQIGKAVEVRRKDTIDRVHQYFDGFLHPPVVLLLFPRSSRLSLLG